MVRDAQNAKIDITQADRSWRASLLELMLPDGFAKDVLVLGRGCPQVLLPEGALLHAATGRAELCILAPDEDESRSERWLTAAAGRAAAALADHGLVYILAAPRCRPGLLRALHARGLRSDGAWRHQPDVGVSRYLTPLKRNALAFTYGGVVPVRPWRRGLARAVMALPGWTRPAAMRLPSVGLVARRSGDRPLFEWLWREAKTAVRGEVVIGSSWRGHGAVVIHLLSPRGQPVAIAKTVLAPADGDGLGLEVENLKNLAADACLAGAQTPALVGALEVRGRPVVVQTVVRGRPADHALEVHPGRLEGLLEELTTWLGGWHAITRRDEPVETADLRRWILRPAADLAPNLAEGEAFSAHLAALCAAVARQSVPRVAAHGDLTMANVLISGPHEGLSVVDWEQAEPAGLPLTDFFYAAADAVASLTGYRDRPAAFANCFLPGGNHAGLVSRLVRRLGADLGLTSELVELCFFATWLHHAANERATGRPGEPRPFLAMLQRATEWSPRAVVGGLR